MVQTIEPYTKSYLFSQRDRYYYIHRALSHIGMAQGGDYQSDAQLARLYAGKREQVSSAVRRQYANLFKQSINWQTLDSESQQLLSQEFEKDDVMKEINDQLMQDLYKVLNVEKMQALMNQYKKTEDINFKRILNDCAGSAKNFNDFLDVLAQCGKLIRNEEYGEKLAMYLANAKRGDDRSLTISNQHLGTALQKELNRFERDVRAGKRMRQLNDFDLQQINHIINQINTFAKHIKKIQRAQGRPEGLTMKSMSRLLTNIFSSGFAEAVSAELKTQAYSSIIKVFDNAKLIGKDTVSIAYTDEMGNFVKEIETPQAGKADIKLQNVSLSLNRFNKQVTMSLGISDKFYKNAYFPNVNTDVRRGEIHSGQTGKIKDILTMIFGEQNLRNLYLSYNTLAHGERLNTAQEALIDIMAKRSIIYLFSARGQSDFAHFLFINNQIISIWDLILSTQEFLGKTASYASQAQQPFYLTFGEGHSKMYENAENQDTVARVYETNKAINKISLSAVLNLDNFADLQQKIFSKYS